MTSRRTAARPLRAAAPPRLPLLAGAVLGTFLIASGPAWAGSAEAGKEKIRSKGCITCHDAQGQGTDTMFPNLAGQSEAYLQQQLEAFRSGKRQAPQMSIVTQNLSDEDIADLVAYYAGLPPCGE